MIIFRLICFPHIVSIVTVLLLAIRLIPSCAYCKYSSIIVFARSGRQRVLSPNQRASASGPQSLIYPMYVSQPRDTWPFICIGNNLASDPTQRGVKYRRQQEFRHTQISWCPFWSFHTTTILWTGRIPITLVFHLNLIARNVSFTIAFIPLVSFELLHS